MLRLTAFLALAALGAAYAFRVYDGGELRQPRGRQLAALRAVTICLLLALILELPGPGSPTATTPRRWVLLDVSASMSAGAATGADAWSGALARARVLHEQGWTVVPFGASVAPAGLPLLEDAPVSGRTRLAPALSLTAEAGVGEVRVLSDLRFEDPVEAAGMLADTPLGVTFEGFGADVKNAGVAEFAVADAAHPGDSLLAEVEFFGSGGADSLTLEIRLEGRLVSSSVHPLPPAGLRSVATFVLPPPEGTGRMRFTAAVHVPGDAFPEDDLASAYANVGHQEGAVVLVSLRPDWEPRFLLPVLAAATGLRAVGYLRVAPDRFDRIGRALDRGPTVDSATVGAAAADAALLVVHGVHGPLGAWERTLVTRKGRVLVFAVDSGGAAVAGVLTGPALAGEWYASASVPASALAGDLAGVALQELPPLTDVLPLSEPGSRGVPLRLRLRESGPGAAALILDRQAGVRRAVVLASGFWRWGMRDQRGRDAYRSLWSGVAGWLLEPDARVTTPDVRPDRWVFARDTPVLWHVPGDSASPVTIAVHRGDTLVVETTVGAGGSVSMGVLFPGSYAFRAERLDGSPVGEGRFDVEATTLELLPTRRTPELPPDRASAPGEVEGGGRPLRTLPWPYLLILLLLSAEWIGRRRVGLR